MDVDWLRALQRFKRFCTEHKFCISYVLGAQVCKSGLSLSAGCRLNSPAEKEVIARLILTGRSLGKRQRTVFTLHMHNHLIPEPYRTVNI